MDGEDLCNLSCTYHAAHIWTLLQADTGSRWLYVVLLENIPHFANDNKMNQSRCVCAEPGAFLGRQLPGTGAENDVDKRRANRQGAPLSGFFEGGATSCNSHHATNRFQSVKQRQDNSNQ